MSALSARDAPTGTDVMAGDGGQGDENARADREAARRARAELGELEAAYRRAIGRGLTEDSPDGIDAAFDEADRLQSRLLSSIHRVRVLEQRLAEAAKASGSEARVGSMAQAHQTGRERS